MEFTGLNPDEDAILEVASIVSDGLLNVVAEGPVVVVHQPDDVLSGMDEWNREHHTLSGLYGLARASTETVESAEAKTLKFLSRHCTPAESPLCGNSVHMDRMFIRKHMRKLYGFLHYRNIDVSTVKELAGRWYPDQPPYVKSGAHRALDDVRESIRELRHYRSLVFK